MEKLLFLREQLNVTQKAVADYIGLSRQAYAHYEFGDRYPDLKTLCKLADFLGFRSIICLEGKHVILHFLPRLRNINAFMKASRERRRRIF